MPSGPEAGEQLDAALEGVRATLAADGYSLEISCSGGEIALRVVAGAGACEECLVPKHLFALIVADALDSAGLTVAPGALAVRYPADGIHRGP